MRVLEISTSISRAMWAGRRATDHTVNGYPISFGEVFTASTSRAR
jgi:hypothetical protein